MGIAARLRRRLLATLAAVLVVVGLAGCGAVIDTTLSVNADGSGERVMVLTLEPEDIKELEGDSAAIDESIRARLPESLDFSGVGPSSSGGLTATFRLRFSSPSDYVEKATALLELGEVAVSPPTFSVSDTLLVKGASIEEGFTSHSLLRWMFVGLVEDGIVSSSTSERNMYELGATTLEFAEQQRTQPYGQFNDSILDDHGFASVASQTGIVDADDVQRTLTFRADEDADDELYVEYLSEHTPDGAELKRAGNTWSMTFQGSLPEIEAATDVALSTSGSVFDIEWLPSPSDPAVMTITVTSASDCASVCATDAPPVTDTVLAPNGFTPAKLPLGAHDEPGQMKFVPAFEHVSQELSIGPFGNVSATSTFIVSSSSVEVVGDGFEQLLAPSDRVGSLDVSVDGRNTVYTVKIEARAEEFGARYAEWAPESTFVMTGLDGASFFSSATRYAFDGGLGGIIGAHPVSETPQTTIVLPWGSWVSVGEPTAELGKPLTVETRSIDLVGIIVTIGVVGIAAVGLTFAVRRREALREWVVNWRGDTPSSLLGLPPVWTRTRPSLTLMRRPPRTSPASSLLDMSTDAPQRLIRAPLLDMVTPPPVSASHRGMIDPALTATSVAVGQPLIGQPQKTQRK